MAKRRLSHIVAGLKILAPGLENMTAEMQQILSHATEQEIVEWIMNCTKKDVLRVASNSTWSLLDIEQLPEVNIMTRARGCLMILGTDLKTNDRSVDVYSARGGSIQGKASQAIAGARARDKNNKIKREYTARVLAVYRQPLGKFSYVASTVLLESIFIILFRACAVNSEDSTAPGYRTFTREDTLKRMKVELEIFFDICLDEFKCTDTFVPIKNTIPLSDTTKAAAKSINEYVDVDYQPEGDIEPEVWAHNSNIVFDEADNRVFVSLGCIEFEMDNFWMRHIGVEEDAVTLTFTLTEAENQHRWIRDECPSDTEHLNAIKLSILVSGMANDKAWSMFVHRLSPSDWETTTGTHRGIATAMSLIEYFMGERKLPVPPSRVKLFEHDQAQLFSNAGPALRDHPSFRELFVNGSTVRYTTKKWYEDTDQWAFDRVNFPGWRSSNVTIDGLSYVVEDIGDHHRMQECACDKMGYMCPIHTDNIPYNIQDGKEIVLSSASVERDCIADWTRPADPWSLAKKLQGAINWTMRDRSKSITYDMAIGFVLLKPRTTASEVIRFSSIGRGQI